MKEIRKTSQFKKDYKRFSKDLNKVKLLFSIVEKLANGEDIPSEFKPHQLKGEWKGKHSIVSEAYCMNLVHAICLGNN